MSDGIFLLVFGGALIGAAALVAVIRSLSAAKKSSNKITTFGLQE